MTHMSQIAARIAARTAARIAAVGVTSLVVTALAAVPAGAASGNLVFVCNTVLGDKEFPTVADTDLPATLVAGSSVPTSVSAKVTIPDDVRNAVYTIFGARSVSGTATVKATQNGAALPDIATTVAEAAVPASGPVTVTATGAGPLFAPTASGTYVLKAVSYTASLVFKKGDGTAAYTADVSCTPKAASPAQDLTVDTVTVTDAGTTPPPTAAQETTTKVKGSYARKQKKIVATIKVGSDDKAATGKAKVVVRLGKKIVKKATVDVRAGKAKVVLKKVTKPGSYKITVSYAGDDTHQESTGRATVKVS